MNALDALIVGVNVSGAFEYDLDIIVCVDHYSDCNESGINLQSTTARIPTYLYLFAKIQLIFNLILYEISLIYPRKHSNYSTKKSLIMTDLENIPTDSFLPPLYSFFLTVSLYSLFEYSMHHFC